MVFPFLEYHLFVLEILTCLFCANYESDDVMRFETKMVKYWQWINKISGNINAVNLGHWHQKCTTQNKPNDIHGIVAKETLLAPVSFCQNQTSSFSNLPSGTEGPAWNKHGSYIVLTLIIRLTGVHGPRSRQKLKILLLTETGPVAKLLTWQQHNRFLFVSFEMNISGAKSEEHSFNISRDSLFTIILPF